MVGRTFLHMECAKAPAGCGFGSTEMLMLDVGDLPPKCCPHVERVETVHQLSRAKVASWNVLFRRSASRVADVEGAGVM